MTSRVVHFQIASWQVVFISEIGNSLLFHLAHQLLFISQIVSKLSSFKVSYSRTCKLTHSLLPHLSNIAFTGSCWFPSAICRPPFASRCLARCLHDHMSALSRSEFKIKSPAKAIIIHTVAGAVLFQSNSSS